MTVHGDVVSHVNISHVAVKDGGLYICKVNNRAGTQQHAARLNVYGTLYHTKPIYLLSLAARLVNIYHRGGNFEIIGPKS